MKRYSREDERYRFLRLFAIDFDGVRHSLSVLRRYRKADVRYCILRELVVAYARPFSGNRGDHFTKHRLSEKFVPRTRLGLHRELLELREQYFAHTDYRFQKPKVSRWLMKSGFAYPMTLKIPDYASLERRVRDIEELVKEVEVNVLNAIRQMEVGSEPAR